MTQAFLSMSGLNGGGRPWLTRDGWSESTVAALLLFEQKILFLTIL